MARRRHPLLPVRRKYPLRRRNDAARRNAGLNVLVAQTWDTLARLRLADGDIEGAERARVSARATSPRRR